MDLLYNWIGIVWNWIFYLCAEKEKNKAKKSLNSAECVGEGLICALEMMIIIKLCISLYTVSL